MIYSDFRSDTVTKPTEKMRKAMAEAEVGDDVLGDDPTVWRLEALAAGMMGKEAGLFCPSGTTRALRCHRFQSALCQPHRLEKTSSGDP